MEAVIAVVVVVVMIVMVAVVVMVAEVGQEVRVSARNTAVETTSDVTDYILARGPRHAAGHPVLVSLGPLEQIPLAVPGWVLIGIEASSSSSSYSNSNSSARMGQEVETLIAPEKG